MAEARGVGFAPHNPNGPVGTAASLHVAQTCPNLLVHEYFEDLRELRKMLGEEPLSIIAGHAAAPDVPGLGVTISDATLDRFVSDAALPDLGDSVYGYSHAALSERMQARAW